MVGGQIKIRDFGEKVRYLIGKRSCEELPVLCEDYQGNFPPEFVAFRNETAFAKWLGVDNSALVQWRSEARQCGFRLAPQLEQVKKFARQFGIWPKSDRDEDIPSYWSKCWPSWYSGEATDQFKKAYARSRGGDQKPDSLNAFQKAYCSALALYAEDPENSPLYFPAVKDQRSRRQATQDLSRIIRRAPQVLEIMQRQLGMESLPAGVLPDGAIDNDIIAKAVDWLLDADIDAVISACQQAYSETREEANDQRSSICAVLVELAQRIIPALYDHYSVSRIKSALGAEIGALIELPVHHRTVADIIVAAAEGRATSYHARKKREDWPVPARSFIDQTPDSGFDGHAQRTKDVQDQIAKCFTAANAKDVYNAVREYVAGGPFYRYEPGTGFTDEEKFELAGKNLRQRMKFERRCFYMIFYLPKAKDDRADINALIEKLRKKLPGMLFLALDKKTSLANAEIDQFGPFVWMLPAEAEDGGGS